ncbi:MAG: outer membrane protein assembly factor BamC [Pseudomonadaceae bacterium]|nr:MAG: outer membrane protein assembly factor BamC [Pseudomonadaceae bacterium]
MVCFDRLVIMFIKEYAMKPVLGALSLVIAGSLTGCGYLMGDDGFFRDRGSDYQVARVEPRMSVPEGLDSKPIGDMLPVPGTIADGSGEKFVVPRPEPIPITVGSSYYSLQQDGGRIWLQSQDSQADTWPLVRQFLSDYRVGPAAANAELGEAETEWLDFASRADNSLVRRLVPAVGEGRRTRGRDHRFLIRVEPGQSGTSEVHAVHMTRSSGGEYSEWPQRSENPNLERTLLAELESYLNQLQETGATSLAEQDREPVSFQASLSQDGAGNPVLNLQTDFNRGWSLVGSALARADLPVADINRSAGVYYIDADAVARAEQAERGFFSRMLRRSPRPQADGERLQVRLTQTGQQVAVSVDRSIDSAADPDQARELLTRIRDNLN